MTAGHWSIAFAPLLPWWLIAGAAVVAVLLIALCLWRRARGTSWRVLALLVLLGALINPSAVKEERRMIDDVAVLAIDESSSEQIAPRPDQIAAAAPEIEKRLRAIPGLELRVVRVKPARSEADNGTELMTAVKNAVADLPPSRLAGVVLLSDGEIHDLPEDPKTLGIDAPVHLLLTGREGEGDRRLTVPKLPSYGIVGQKVEFTIRVDDLPQGPPAGRVRVDITRDGEALEPVFVPTGQDTNISIDLQHAGETLFELKAEAGPQELTLANNSAFITVNGVRDRLRVLLVSGEPHPGERTWRNLLKSDPGVDLVHFTILRPPEKQDGTPVRELSLIAFPTRELFEEKLSDFDLIIFDRYHRRGILANAYLQNIARFVQDGGAVLEAGGPSYASPFGLFRTPLGEIMPVVPTGEVVEQGYRPTVSAVGRRHPVTADLEGAGKPAAEGQPATPPTWGRWFNITEGDARRGEVLMEGPGGRPLLVLDRVGKGRVAQIMSDQIWLWGRGFDGGGPQAELLRRISHWLMKEPELEEDDLRAVARGSEIQITRHSLKVDESPVTVRSPSGEEQSLTLADQGDGRAVATFHASEQGLHRISDERHTVYAVAGTLNPLEFADVRSTPEKLEPVIKAQGGSANWLADGRVPDIRRVAPERTVAGRGWIGLRANGDYIVRGVTEIPLLPALATLALAIGTLLFAWRREGR
jgi:hypothetical protein